MVAGWRGRIPLGVVAACVVAVAQTGTAAAGQPDEIAAARDHYNAGRFDQAIAAAEPVWHATGAPAAAVVIARARLERFRHSGQPAELAAARELLRAVDPARLSPMEQTEWELGVAAALYWRDDFGPAAEILDRLLRAGGTGESDRDRLIDWWASAVDRAGHDRQLDDRAQTYRRLAERLEAELAHHPTATAASYWLVAAVRGAGDIERAWNLAIAGWVRAGVGNAGLRADLDRIVRQGVIPDLAAIRSGRPPDHPETLALRVDLIAEWEAVTSGWTP